MRVRGLKRHEGVKYDNEREVAPHAGAWIETNRMHISSWG